MKIFTMQSDVQISRLASESSSLEGEFKSEKIIIDELRLSGQACLGSSECERSRN